MIFDRNTERRGFPGGLRAQLLLGLGVLVVGTMGLVALVGVHLTRRQIERSELQQTTADARHLANLNRTGATERLVEGYRETAELAYVHLEGPDGTETAGKWPGNSELGSLGNGDDVPSDGTRAFTREFGGEAYAVAIEEWSVADSEARAVAIRSLAPAHRRIADARRMLVAYLGIDALFILIVGYAFLTYLVVRPIRAIGVATRRAARGDLASHIELLPSNEFGEVGRSFNRMLDELRDNRRELEQRLEELDRAYRDLEQTQDSLIRSEKMASVGELAAGVAHEIGNPLSAIAGYLDLLDEDLDPDKRRDILERMRSQVDRMQTIIRDLLDFSRGDEHSPIEEVDLATCIREATDLLAPQPNARKIDIHSELPADLPPVSANDDQVVQVLVNLLMNASQAIGGRETEGTIRLEAEADEEDVILRVTDDGPGIPPEDRDRIFDPFYTSKETGEGTGLGLAIAHRIMERFDGSISVDSSVGEGTTFALRFERADLQQDRD